MNYLSQGAAKSRFQCAGINRHEAENAKFSRVRSSDPLGPEFCVGAPRGARRSVNRGIGGVGYGAPKRCNPDADVLVMRGRRSEERRVGKEGRSRWSPY